ncbi:MAG: hypothetical protein NVSMB21_01100 [Vulcanimicrobiaceae bacterium]
MLGLVLAIPQAPRPDPQSRYVSGRATPGPPMRDDASHGREAPPVGGEAPWALSALPACFRQIRLAAGTVAFVRSKVPHAARRVAAGATLATADCRLRVGANDAAVIRGENAFHIPAPARLFVWGKRLLLETRVGRRATLRTYTIVAGGPPHFSER